MTLRQAVFGRLPVFVAGLYCLLVTVLPVGFASSAPPLARAGAWFCLGCLAACLLVPVPRIALLAGTIGVLGGALVVFTAALGAGRELAPPRLGVLGFFALPLAWGALSSPLVRHGVGQGTSAEWLRPRRAVPRWQVTLAGVLLFALPALLLVPLGLESKAKTTFALVLSLGLVVLCARGTSDVLTHVWLEGREAVRDPARVRNAVGRLVLFGLALAALVVLCRS